MPFIRFFTRVTGLLGILILSFSAQAASLDNFFFQTMGDLQEDLEYARDEEKKAVMLFFEMDECPFCRRMKQTVFNQEAVQQYYGEHFLVIPIDIEGDTELVDFQGKSMTSKAFAETEHRVRATPVLMFFDLEGKPLYRHTGPTRDAKEFLWLGEFILSGQYANKRFSQYRREQAKAQ